MVGEHEAGFIDTHLELHIDVTAALPMPWSGLLASAPHPLAPTAGRIFNELFDAGEKVTLEEFLRPSIEAGVGYVTPASCRSTREALCRLGDRSLRRELFDVRDVLIVSTRRSLARA